LRRDQRKNKGGPVWPQVYSSFHSLLAESSRGVGTAWPDAAFRGDPGNVNDRSMALFGEQRE
jgi:hypothetical protein